MCHYCGCRHISLIRDYIAEHERGTDLGGDAVRVIDTGDLDKARQCISKMAGLLAMFSPTTGRVASIMGRDRSDSMARSSG